jgi:molybdenum cofactor cytidylyltransferase
LRRQYPIIIDTVADADFSGIALVLLAAGQGRRFGGGKLAAELGGKPVALHAAAMLGALPFAARFAVVGPQTPDLIALGFTALPLDPPGAPQSRSLAIGVGAVQAMGARAVLVALADMPLVSSAHIEALVAAFDGNLIASIAQGRRMPPAIFAAHHFPELAALSGDRGAASLLQGTPAIEITPREALDIDYPEDLAMAAAHLSGD